LSLFLLLLLLLFIFILTVNLCLIGGAVEARGKPGTKEKDASGCFQQAQRGRNEGIYELHWTFE
jgi:hypothetical protein